MSSSSNPPAGDTSTPARGGPRLPPGDPDRRSTGAGPGWLSFLRVAAWILPVVMVVLLAGLQLRRGGVTSGLSVADYRAQAMVERFAAPDFTLPVLGASDTSTLSALRGDVVVLNFWASWCLPCRREAPALEATWRAYRSKSVSFVGVNERDDVAAAGSFVDEFEISYPSVSDPSGALAFDYSLLGLPETFLIDPSGTVRFRFRGYLDEAALRSALDELLDPAEGG